MTPPSAIIEQTPSDIARFIQVMSDQYGPFPEEARLDAAHEIVFTILSQHTSDINSSRAFRLLMERFGSLEQVAQADTAEIETAIAPGGLAKVKAPRIKQVLNLILELNGSLETVLPAGVASGGGQGLAEATSGHRSQVGGNNP